MEIGKMLKEKRAEHELTQEELSEKIFVSKKTISNWETGKTTPDLDSLIRLANLFDLSLDNLLLEGSSIVENIKHDMELKTLRVIQICNILISLCTMLVVFVSDLPYLVLIAFVVIGGCNLLTSFYIEDRVKKVKK
ncbi:helix-turn-helix domain-containing protein [Vagococcus carniphilus]|uniref:HTH cro/C1-type domain-containing protein n=1 Tax=Vagococcus carniphilus TaxID=218144 RepID=A0A430B8M7_9ENTE|nr:helix-turn-helix transcriptional regulator [Vagococcus carniphilus]QNN73801.1 helix-turn-helix transcriptional regulator [Vagococcus carniphilus]RSU16671.1 hypothetical protein CBF28_00355 [Vagococcus carniphilus]